MLSFFYFWSIYNLPVLVVGVRDFLRTSKETKRASHSSKKKFPAFSIIVPAKDEEKVVGRLLDALLKLNYPPQKREIIVVEDGFTDKTAEICERYSKQYPDQIKLVRQPKSSGKPSALNYALKHVTGEIVAVLDADNVLEPDALSKATKYFEDQSIAAVQGRACSINAHENMLAKFISYEEAVRYETYIRGKDVLKLFVPLTGSCYFVRRNVLEEVDGWDEEVLSEDMEMAAKVTESGYNIKYAPDVRSWQENPSSLTQLFRQRTRWFRGSMEVSLKYGRLLKNFDRKSFDAEMTLIGPFMFLPCMLGYFLGLFSAVFPFSPDPVLTFVSQGLTFVNTVTLLLIGVALIGLTKPKKKTNLRWLPFVYGYWAIQNFVALHAFAQIVLKRPQKWLKTEKTGVMTCEDQVIPAYV